MRYSTCTGCIAQGQPCNTREALSKSLKGLGITSVRFKCKERVPVYQIGDPVWAETYDDPTEGIGEDGAMKCDFPAVIVRDLGSSMLVFIVPDTADRYGDTKFTAKNNGFCKIPLSRLERRDGGREEVCRQCERPKSAGHATGYSCSRSGLLPYETTTGISSP